MGFFDSLFKAKITMDAYRFYKTRSEIEREMQKAGIKIGQLVKRKLGNEWQFGKVILVHNIPNVEFKVNAVIKREIWNPSWVNRY